MFLKTCSKFCRRAPMLKCDFNKVARLLLQLLYVLLCSIELLSNFIFETFKIASCHIENFHCKTLFYSNFKKFWLVQIVFPIVRNLSKINIRKISKPFQPLTTIDLLHKLFLKSSNQSTGQAANRKFENTLTS